MQGSVFLSLGEYVIHTFIMVLNVVHSDSFLFRPSPYTKLVLMEDINALRNGTTEDVRKTATRFCNLHHVRLAMAAAGFVTALVSLAEM